MKRFDTINVIPLIDVMLVLLAIVLTTATFIANDSLDIALPDTENTQSYTPPTDLPVIQLAINHKNQYFADDALQTFAQIEQQLAKLSKEQAIILRVDKQSDFGSFVKLVDSLKGHSLNNLTILTQAQNN